MTGTKVNITESRIMYSNMLTNDPLALQYKAHFELLGGQLPENLQDKMTPSSAGTDQGNVSKKFPSLHAFFGIFNEDGSAATAAGHTVEFVAVAGTRPSFDKALMSAKALAGVALDVLTVDGLREEVWANFEKNAPAAPAKI